jgi:outer membrane protein assembly factor BamA
VNYFTNEQPIESDRRTELIQGLKNLQIFSKVNIQSENDELLIDLEEKWTTIPILKFSSGGGVTQTTVGLYDPNIFGKYVETGLQVEQLAQEMSAVTWFKNPRLFDQRILLDMQLWSINRIRLFYDPTQDDAIENDAYVQNKQKIYIGIEPELNSEMTLKFSAEHNNDSFNRNSISEQMKALYQTKALPDSDEILIFGLGFDYGRLDWNNFLFDGHKFSLNLRRASVRDKNEKDFFQTDLSYIYGVTLSSNSTFAQRFLLSGTSSELIQYRNYFGGLDRIRGFKDNRFNGKYSFLSNTEYRIPVVENHSYVVQIAAFADLLFLSESLSELSSLTAGSVGAGIRLILPKIYRFTIRADLAKPFRKSDDQTLSVGVQQFF